MKIQINTDKTINGNERQDRHFTSLIEDSLRRFQSHLTRIEVHLSDENGSKKGLADIRCLLEARPEGKQPVAVSYQAETVESAISGALEKLKAVLDTLFGRMQNH